MARDPVGEGGRDMTMQVVDRRAFVRSPRDGVWVVGGSYYTRRDGVELMSIHVYSSRSDMMDTEYIRFSADNGRSWSDPVTRPARTQTPRGVLQRHARGGYLDPRTDRFIRLRNQALLPTDSVGEYMTNNTIHYAVSTDGARTDLFDEPLIQAGPEFGEDHPLPGVYRGRNCFMIGDFTCVPITLPDGAILLPCQISPLGPDGSYVNKGGGFTYTDAAVIRGAWRPDGHILWRLAGTATADPERTTRGLIEPTIAELADGRILIVMRGSNDRRPELPGSRWFSISPDQGEHWPPAEPWRYTDGEAFYSPSSCSQLVPHSGGRLFWLGNLCARNPRGNLPRHPFVIAEVDRSCGLVIRSSVTVVDDRRPEEPELVTLSNFSAREDRETGRIVAHVLRHASPTAAEKADPALPARRFQGDCMLYEIAVQ